jgi:hypothetical protein
MQHPTSERDANSGWSAGESHFCTTSNAPTFVTCYVEGQVLTKRHSEEGDDEAMKACART